VTGYALRAHALATGDTASIRAVELARHAIRSWRYLTGLENLDDINPASLENVLQPLLAST
jgi:hypothetical protein